MEKNPNPKYQKEVPHQRKTTLKWTNSGELSSNDMVRILESLSSVELTKCDLSDDDNEKKEKLEKSD